jgi:prepilin-type N-terminal cleavage/methylation domain-containing protein
MICGNSNKLRTGSVQRHRRSRGFTLLEMVLVVAVSLVLAAIAVPAFQTTLRNFALKSAVSAMSGTIQSTRYQAIFHGCTYQLAFNAAAYNYTISSAAPAAGGQACLAAPVQVGNAVPLPGTGVTLNNNVTLQFRADGSVATLVGNAGNMVLTQAHVAAPETIQVSNNGKITVTP